MVSDFNDCRHCGYGHYESGDLIECLEKTIKAREKEIADFGAGGIAENVKLRAEIENLVNKNTEIKVEVFHAKNKMDALVIQIDEAKAEANRLRMEKLEAINRWAKLADEDKEKIATANRLIDAIKKLCRDKKDGCEGGTIECDLGDCWPCSVMHLIEKRSVSSLKEWAICGWCAGGHDDPQGTCPKCSGAKGKWIEKSESK